MSRKLTGLPAAIDRRSLLLWGRAIAGGQSQRACVVARVKDNRTEHALSTQRQTRAHLRTCVIFMADLDQGARQPHSPPDAGDLCSRTFHCLDPRREDLLAWHSAFATGGTRLFQLINDTVFEAAFMSKSVFAFTVMKLAEQRVIDLDASRTKYTNERYVCNDPRPDLITARHVLMHFTGLPKWRSLTVRWQSTSSLARNSAIPGRLQLPSVLSSPI